MTQDKNATVPADAPTDALLARYQAAQTALDAPEASGPSAQARANILNYAVKVATDSVAARAISESAGSPLDTQKPSANDSQWKIRALATVAIFGLTSLLLLQWDRGTPEEKEVAFSTARQPVNAPAPAPAPAPATEPAPAPAPAAVPPMPPATTVAEAPTAARPVDKSDFSTKAAPPSAKLAAPKAAPPPARPSASPQPFPAEADTQRPSGVVPPLPARDAATTAESAMAGATALPAPAPPAAPSAAAAPAPLPAAPSIAAPPAPAPAAAPAVRAAPAAKAQSYGAPQSARRDDAIGAPEATGRLKKAEAADDKSATADASAAPAGRAMSPNLALFAAIRSADAAAVRQALASGADKNAKSNGTPAITLSVQSGKLNLVQLLAGAGADVNAPDAQGITPLAHARARGLDAIANSLIGSGAN
jgi:hypothetical protein